MRGQMIIYNESINDNKRITTNHMLPWVLFHIILVINE